MPTNDFKPFATGVGANVMSQADWVALVALATGFQSGKASSAQVNKALRQSAFIASALAQYTANKTGLDVLDDGDITGFITKMHNAFGADFQPLDATLTAIAALTGAANKLPYFNGADSAALTDLTSVGRDILGKTTAAQILSYLSGAPLDSAPLTGVPTAPTALPGNNTTQLATTAFIQAAITALALGTASQRAVGTGTNQIPDMNSFASSLNTNGYYKLPGGFIIQWLTVTGSTSATVPVTFPLPFPNQLLGTAMAMDWTSPGYPTLQSQTLVGVSVNTWNNSGTRSALAATIIAVGK